MHIIYISRWVKYVLDITFYRSKSYSGRHLLFDWIVFVFPAESSFSFFLWICLCQSLDLTPLLKEDTCWAKRETNILIPVIFCVWRGGKCRGMCDSQRYQQWFTLEDTEGGCFWVRERVSLRMKPNEGT